MRIKEIAAVRVRYGYRRIHVVLQREGWEINHKRVYRLYCEEGLHLRSKRPRRHVSAAHRIQREEVRCPNESWSMRLRSSSMAVLVEPSSAGLCTCFISPKDATFYFGADWGYSVDPTTLVRCFIDGRKLYIDQEVYRVGCEIDHFPFARILPLRTMKSTQTRFGVKRGWEACSATTTAKRPE